MGRDLIISQHALKSTLDHVAKKASHQQWQESQHDEPVSRNGSADALRFQAVLEAAANDPIGLHILARTMVKQETYQQAISNLSRVRPCAQNENAMYARIFRLKRRFLYQT